MSRAESLTKLKHQERHRQQHFRIYIYDSVLAIGSIALLTLILAVFHLYPNIPDSVLLYLLIILPLAATRGLYASLLASFCAFFCFDYFFVPPVHSLLVIKFEDIIALIVFLITAITTSQLASALRRRIEQFSRREKETRILYELVRATNREEDVQKALQIFARTMIEVFDAWGICDCEVLLGNEKNELIPQIHTSSDTSGMHLTQHELLLAAETYTKGQAFDIRMSGPTGSEAEEPLTKPARYYVRFIPLKNDQKVVGVIRLRIEDTAYTPAIARYLVQYPHTEEWYENDNEEKNNSPSSKKAVLSHINEHRNGENGQPPAQALFFSTFLEQATAIIERGRLLQENVHVKVLKQTDALRSALLSSVSHNLRTPLATIKTATTSLLESEMQWNEEEQHSFISAIEREADRLNSLVENLLDMSRIEAGALHPETVWYPLDELVQDVLEHMHDQLQDREICMQVPEGLPPVKLDPVQIDQVITNLLENALRYTPEGSPIDICIQEQEEHVQVSIADKGPGIAPAEQEKIFEKFYRIALPEQLEAKTRGSGLGLAICKSLVEAHGGKIWVTPNTGVGATFYFTLPLTTPEGIC